MTSQGLLKTGQRLRGKSGCEYVVHKYLGGGGQGEVYELKDQPLVVKWYFEHLATRAQRQIVEQLIQQGAPGETFLWPEDLVEAKDIRGFGYVMKIRDPSFIQLSELMRDPRKAPFRILCRIGFELVDSFERLHAQGVCYRDISWANILFDPKTGRVLICDNDNVAVKGIEGAGVLGTPGFMAPEIVLRTATPSTETDLFSLAVLLFYIFIKHHPLEGKKELDIACYDEPAMRKLHGKEPVFIFDPDNEENRPVPGYHDNAILYWKIYPRFFRKLFTKTFTDGLHDPYSRVRESEWKLNLLKLIDSIFYCGRCNTENFYDLERLQHHRSLGSCWYCKKTLQPPPRIRIKDKIIMLNSDTKLYPHHIEQPLFDISKPIAEVTRHPRHPSKWGLRNLSGRAWSVRDPKGKVQNVPPGKAITLRSGIKINFGGVEGEIRK